MELNYKMLWPQLVYLVNFNFFFASHFWQKTKDLKKQKFFVFADNHNW